jgi:uncharacterized protein (TIGR02284 family)
MERGRHPIYLEDLMSEIREPVKTVIQVLHDSHIGFRDIGEHLKDPQAKRFFMEESKVRAKFENELKHACGLTEDVGGTIAGPVHRAWGDLKANLGGGDHTLLDTAEQGEDTAKKAYEEALKDQDVHSSIREVLVRQQSHIREAHDRVKSLRDAKAA